MSCVSTQFKCQTVLFDPQIGPYQVLPLGVSEPGSNGHEEVLHIPQSLTIRLFNVISWTHVVGGESYPSPEVQSAYLTAPADWAKTCWIFTFGMQKSYYTSHYYVSYCFLVAAIFIISQMHVLKAVQAVTRNLA